MNFKKIADTSFKDSIDFELTNFPFKTKYDNNAVYSGYSNCYSRGESKKKIC